MAYTRGQKLSFKHMHDACDVHIDHNHIFLPVVYPQVLTAGATVLTMRSSVTESVSDAHWMNNATSHSQFSPALLNAMHQKKNCR